MIKAGRDMHQWDAYVGPCNLIISPLMWQKLETGKSL